MYIKGGNIMSDIDINRVLQNIGELQDQNAIDFQHWIILEQEIEKLKEDYESKVMQLVQENEGLKRQLDQQLSKGGESEI